MEDGRRAEGKKKGKGREKKREEGEEQGATRKSLGVCRMTRSRIRNYKNKHENRRKKS